MSTFQENISSSAILNRKLIVELRFAPVAEFFDKKGVILEEMAPLIPNSFWSLGDMAIRLSDAQTEDKSRSSIVVEVNRFAFVSSKIDTLQRYVDDVTKMYSILTKTYSKIRIKRIGCRIQGSYKTRSKKFDDVLLGFKQSFPTSLFFDDFSLNGLRLEIRHSQGMYILGPVNVNDSFVNRNFTYDDKKEGVGIGIDTDNFLIDANGEDLNDVERIYDVIRASLAVEKTLIERFGSL